MLVGELPWESPERCTIRFKCWADGKAIDKRPWNKIDVIPLTLIKRMLDPDPFTRVTIPQIHRDPWLQDSVMEIDSALSSAKRQRLSLGAAFSQPAEFLSMTSKSVDDAESNGLTDSHIQLGGLPAISFSQPDVIDFLSKSQADSTQTVQIHPLQKLARRMTRFCVSVSQQEAVASISRICSANGFHVKTQIPQQLVAVSIGRGKHELALVVTIFEMVEDGQRKVLADFRRSKGDGIEFKRIFLIVRKQMESVICKESYDWLVKQGFLCSSERMKSLKISPSIAPLASITNFPERDEGMI
uniref:Non-specific serine/threonine protein kinase n=1 Tax=Ditylenchus dipsaci TaxID=166011 RepID=A0A915EMG6_9BILA